MKFKHQNIGFNPEWMVWLSAVSDNCVWKLLETWRVQSKMDVPDEPNMDPLVDTVFLEL